MKLNSEKLIGLDVVTQSGHQLGKLGSFNIETDSQSILEYAVKPANIVKDLIVKDLIISRGQVVDITADKIIVDDGVVGNGAREKNKKTTEQKAVSGAALKEN